LQHAQRVVVALEGAAADETLALDFQMRGDEDDIWTCVTARS
jgi:hypothetical protein